MYFDGSKMLAGLGARVILTSPTNNNIWYVLQIMYTDSNNAAKYEALLDGLRMATSMGIQRLEVRGDSNLAICQANSKFDAKDPKMVSYLSVSWTWGYPFLPARGPPRGSIGGLVRPSFDINTTRPSRGAKPHEADDAETPEGVGLLRRAPKGRRDLCSYLMRLS